MKANPSLSGVDGPNLESSTSGIHWGAIIGGAAACTVITLVLIPLGTALGFSTFSVYTPNRNPAMAITLGLAIWLIIVQWISAAIGGYLAGRLRVKWVDAHSDEVFFRDTAHGFIAWAVATLFTVSLVAGAAGSTVGAGVQAGATAVDTISSHMSYMVDSLYRSNTGGQGVSAETAAETTRILLNDVANNGISTPDKTYLTQQVARVSGLSEPEAASRVNATLKDINTAEQKAAEVAEAARKATVDISIILFLSLVIGAFIASVSGAIGGRLRDQF